MRPLRRDDLEGVHALFSDPEAMRFSLTGVRDLGAGREWLETMIRKFEEHRLGLLGADLKADGSYAGHVGLIPQEVDGRQELEVGYWIRRDLWGQGLASEAAAACRDHGFRVLGRDRLISLIVPENVASRRVAEKIGMQLERETSWREVRVCIYAIERPA